MNAPSFSLAALSPGLATAAVPLTRGAKAAQEFEAHLLASLIDSMEKTFATLPGQDSVPGADNYNYLGTDSLAKSLAASGGFGIGSMITKYLAEHEGKG
jgi:Rod binding domain-containing protein